MDSEIGARAHGGAGGAVVMGAGGGFRAASASERSAERCELFGSNRDEVRRGGRGVRGGHEVPSPSSRPLPLVSARKRAPGGTWHGNGPREPAEERRGRARNAFVRMATEPASAAHGRFIEPPRSLAEPRRDLSFACDQRGRRRDPGTKDNGAMPFCWRTITRRSRFRNWPT